MPIWKWRCNNIFVNASTTIFAPYNTVFKNTKEWWDAINNLAFANATILKNIAWILPDQGWLKLNIDGSREHADSNIAAGGVIHNDAKEWILGFALNRDSKEAVDLITANSNCYSPFLSIINGFKKLLEGQWSCSLNHTYKEANRVADRLAKLGHTLHLGVTIFVEPPPCISPMLEDDLRSDGIIRPLWS
ncbi:hypothetical protein ACOSQ2_024353 [Xanthoceras sorbifolium]